MRTLIRVRKAQSALEYMMIIGLSLLIIVPSTYFFLSYSAGSSTQIIDSQVLQMGQTIVSSAATVYYSGRDSKLTIDVTMPNTINNVYIIGNTELVMNVTSQNGYSELIFVSEVNISSDSCSGNFCYLDDLSTGGLKKVQLRSIDNGNQVLIQKV